MFGVGLQHVVGKVLRGGCSGLLASKQACNQASQTTVQPEWKTTQQARKRET